MSNIKKIAIVGTVGVPANYGGFETLAEHLIEDLGRHHEITVYCSGKKYPKEEISESFMTLSGNCSALPVASHLKERPRSCQRAAHACALMMQSQRPKAACRLNLTAKPSAPDWQLPA